jgi:hypothetical protein
MRIFFLLVAFFLFLQTSYAQNTNTDSTSGADKICLTIGILQGGGSIIGLDAEGLVAERLGLQLGAGLIGYGAAINYHFKPTIRSSFLSLTYSHQGFGNTYTQSIIGPTYVYRSKKWFTAQIGIGRRVGKGPALDQKEYDKTPIVLLYSIGAYFTQ